MFKLKNRPKPVIIEDYYPDYTGRYSRNTGHHKSSKRRFWVLLMMLIGISSLLWYSVNAAAMSTNDIVEHSSNREGYTSNTGELLLKGVAGGSEKRAVMQHSAVDFDIGGLVAHVSLKQTFVNQSADWAEGVYAFPLPEKAAVKRLTIRIGERVIEGQIKEKMAARKLYKAAKSTGNKAALVEQQRPNLFTTNVANIPPGETVVVELDYLQTVHYEQGQFSLRFPMTITPRYIPGVPLLAVGLSPALADGPSDGDDSETTKALVNRLFTHKALSVENGSGWAFNTDQVPDASRISPYLNPRTPTLADPINPISITASIDMGLPLNSVDSAYHAVVLSRQDNRYRVRLSSGQVSMEQDFVLSWQPVVGNEPKAALFSEMVDGEAYALMMVLPPTAKQLQQGLPKEVIYIIDTSGSMDGVSIQQAKKSLLLALDKLRGADRFNIIEFNSQTLPLFSMAVDANSNNLQRARSYVNAMNSGGGTEMLPALKAALKDKAPEHYVRQVIFITDGAVGNEAALFTEIQQQLGDSRLFTVGIGSAPNSYFMRKAAQFGKGTFTHIGEITEVEEKMSQLFNKLDSPIMSNLNIQWPASMSGEVYPQQIPDLYLGEPLMISARLITADGSPSSGFKFEGLAAITGELPGKKWQQTIALSGAGAQPGVATLWAREKISSLLDEKIAGRNESEVRADVLAVALQHSLMSPYTSFVAVEQFPSRPEKAVLNSTAVSNARPKGQGPQTYAYPRTATRGTQSLLLGCVFMLLALMWFMGNGKTEVSNRAEF